MDKSREQFEKIAAEKLNFSLSTVIYARNGDAYDSDILSTWWNIWQASRAVIEIELPNIRACCSSHVKCREAHKLITDYVYKQGLKVKE